MQQPNPWDVLVDAARNMGAAQRLAADHFSQAQPRLDLDGTMVHGNIALQDIPGAEPSASAEHAAPLTPGDPLASGSHEMTKAERQVILNKAAQRRYRERKKAKTDELQSAANELHDKVRELSIVNAEKKQLRDQIESLQKQIARKESDIESVEQQQRQQGYVARAEVSQGMWAGGIAQNSIDRSKRDLGSKFSHEVACMMTWLGDHGLLSPDGNSVQRSLLCTDLAPEQIEELRDLGQQCYSSCLQCLSHYADVDVALLLNISLKSNQAELSRGATDWRMSLSEKAREDALHVRQQYISRLEEVFYSRQCLNLQAVKVLLPQDVGGLAVSNEGDWREAPIYFKQHQHSSDAEHVLRRLRDILAEEQKALAELLYLVHVKLLDPLQLSRWILASYPHHCDVLPLLNAIHSGYEGKK